jgi:hypothetical protein
MIRAAALEAPESSREKVAHDGGCARVGGTCPGIDFKLDETGDQSLLAGESFDLVYSGLVLQHLPSVAAALRCLGSVP